MMRPTAEIALLAMTAGVRMLEPYNVRFEELFYTIDDTGLWAVMNDMYDAVMENVKYARILKARARAEGEESLTSAEEQSLKLFEKELQNLTMAMRLQQVFCEGHRLKMQDYIFQQVDNSMSYNLIDATAMLILKLSKNTTLADCIDPQEAEVLGQAIELLVEVMQGPATRNQLQLSVSGLVEASMKVLKSDMTVLCATADEEGCPPLEAMYPKFVRNLKAQWMKLVGTMMEG